MQVSHWKKALLEKASDLIRAATSLGASAAPAAAMQLRDLLRSMNSYYTHRIEGEHTRPSDIERALVQDFSANADLARKQRLAAADAVLFNDGITLDTLGATVGRMAGQFGL